VIAPLRCPPHNPGELLETTLLAIAVGLLLIGSAGCKKDERTHSSKPQNEAPAIPAVRDEKSQDDSSAPHQAHSQPKPEVSQAVRTAPDTSEPAINDRKSMPVEPAAGLPAQSTKSAPSGSSRKRSPQEAVAAAKNSQQSATQFARQGKLEPAYRAAVEGWQMVRIHSSDPNCKQLAAQLLEDIKNYSDQLVKAAGGEAGMPNDSKPIRFE
jgi:hypothetical protein